MRYVFVFLLGVAVGGAAVLYLLPKDRNAARLQESISAATPEGRADAPPPASSRSVLPTTTVAVESPVDEPVTAETSIKTDPQVEVPALSPESIVIPVLGVQKQELRDMFTERRGDRMHGAIDIPAARGTPVLAAIDGSVAKLFLSRPGGITVYEYDPTKASVYYYAHLDGYAPGLAEGQQLRRGDVIGFVGTTGNAPPDSPHLHFAIDRLSEPGRWWKGEAIDPFPLLYSRGVTIQRH